MTQANTESQPQTQASTKQHYDVTKAHLPLSCPMPNMRLWDSHPRVYLPIENTGKETCPYCGAEFTLVDSDKA